MDPPIIFVIDDDASVRTAIRRLLLSLHHPIRMFASAEQFLAHARCGTRGCLILDVGLPGMNGLQLLEQLARQEWKLPAIVVTGQQSDESRDAALRLGAMSVLQKPFDRKQFLTSVHAAIAQSQN
jgi:FixJ family two-component response regulator